LLLVFYIAVNKDYHMFSVASPAPPLQLTTSELNDCLDDKRENYQNCSVLCCVLQ